MITIDEHIKTLALYSFLIPVHKHTTKKNNRPIYKNKGRVFLGKSTELIETENYITRELQVQFSGGTTINFPIWTIFRFHFPEDHFFTKKGTINAKLPDLSNLYQLPEDCLQAAGVIKNDSLIHSHDLSRRLPNEKYLLEIHILKYDELYE